MKLKNAFSIILGFVVMATAAVYAEDEKTFDEIQVLDHPRYSLNGRFNLDIDFTLLPLDAYYKPVLLESALSYQFNDVFAVEIARFGYSLSNINTGLYQSYSDLSTRVGEIPKERDLADLKYKVGSAVFVNLLYSKSNFFNLATVYHNWQVGGGMTYFNMGSKSQIGADLLLKVRFFLTEDTTLNLHGGHTIGLNADQAQNITQMGLGIGFAF